MKIAVGAPVAERAWALPFYFRRMRQQIGIKIDYACYVYSESQDNTLDTLKLNYPQGAQLKIQEDKRKFYPRSERNTDRSDPNRTHHFSALRNQLRKLFLQTDADIFFSIDTDIMMEDIGTMQRMVEALEDGWDVVSPVTHLHPLGGQNLDCFNAGYLAGGEGFTQVWTRADAYARFQQSPVQIQIPMACVAIRRHTMTMAKYKGHECGEDIGFAQNLAMHGARVGWLTDLEVRHVWGPEYFGEEAYAVPRLCSPSES